MDWAGQYAMELADRLDFGNSAAGDSEFDVAEKTVDIFLRRTAQHALSGHRHDTGSDGKQRSGDGDCLSGHRFDFSGDAARHSGRTKTSDADA